MNTHLIGKYFNFMSYVLPNVASSQSMKLLSYVQRTPISEEGKRFFAQGSQRTIKLTKGTAVLHKWGHGSKNIIMLHGWQSHSQRWQPYVSQLDLNEFTVYALDAPGHGMAPGKTLNIEIYREAYAKVLEQVGHTEAVVCHSLGSLVASYHYLLYPETPIERFVIMGAPSGMDAIFYYFEEKLNLGKRAIGNLKKKVDSILSLPSEIVGLHTFFDRVEQPVLVVHDRTDRVTPFKPIEDALKGKDHIQTIFSDGLGHDLKDERIYNKILDFITSEKSKNYVSEAI